MRLRIGVDLSFIYKNRNGGVGTYVREVIERLRLIRDVEWILYCNHDVRRVYSPLRDVVVKELPISGARQATRVVCQQTVLPMLAARDRCRVLFCPGYLSPVIHTVPVVATIHDTQFIDVPHSISAAQRWAYRTILPMSSRTADVVITVSEFSKTRIESQLKVDPRRIRVIHHGKPSEVCHVSTGEREAILSKYGIKHPYVFSVVSGGAAHKNVRRLVRGFMRFRSSSGAESQLVIAGNRPFNEDSADSSVVVTGFVSSRELAALYSGATCFAFPSYYEGFGLPVLEAMRHGLPVAASSAASIPEVGGDSVLYFDPYSEEAIASALCRLMTDDNLRAMLTSRGFVRSTQFSWDRCAVQTLDVFKALLVPYVAAVV